MSAARDAHAGAGHDSLRRNTVLCVAAFAGMGICGGVSVVSHSNMLFETCPHDHRLAHITVGNLVMSAPLIAAPLLAGVLAAQLGLAALFRVCLAISLAAAAWILLRVREPRDLTLADELRATAGRSGEGMPS
jgi:MFS family permease